MVEWGPITWPAFTRIFRSSADVSAVVITCPLLIARLGELPTPMASSVDIGFLFTFSIPIQPNRTAAVFFFFEVFDAYHVAGGHRRRDCAHDRPLEVLRVLPLE